MDRWSGWSSFLVGLGIGTAGAAIVVHQLFNYQKRSTQRKAPRTVPLQDRDTERVRQLKLYHSFPFRSCRCAWLCEELGILGESVEVISVSLHGTDASGLARYKREVHPHGTLPALVLEDGSVMLESSAICLYIAQEFTTRVDLLPDLDKLPAYFNFITYATNTFDYVLEPLYMQLTHTPEDERDQKLVEAKKKQFCCCANTLSAHLQDQLYVCGSKFTAVDCVIGYNIWWASVIQQGALLDDYPILHQYLDRLMSRQAFQKTFKGKKPVKPSGGSL